MGNGLAGGHRTRAERRVDELAAESRRLRRLAAPSAAQRARIAEIQITELPKAWRAVHQAREPR